MLLYLQLLHSLTGFASSLIAIFRVGFCVLGFLSILLDFLSWDKLTQKWHGPNAKQIAFLYKYTNLTTISAVMGVWSEFGLLKLRTCWRYHENLLLQKFNDMYTYLSSYFFFSLWHQWGCQRPFPFIWYELGLVWMVSNYYSCSSWSF